MISLIKDLTMREYLSEIISSFKEISKKNFILILTNIQYKKNNKIYRNCLWFKKLYWKC
jgi:hypothetical protein